MIKHVLFAAAAALAVGVGFSGSAFAQAGGGSLIVYGNDACPAGSICVRAPESERYRIPKSLRSGALPASQQPGRAASVSSVGGVNTGPASCSNIGGGGGSNCLRNQIAASRAEKKAKAAEAAESPLPR